MAPSSPGVGSASPHSPSDEELAEWRRDWATRYAADLNPDSAVIERQRLALQAIRHDELGEVIPEDLEAYLAAQAIWDGRETKPNAAKIRAHEATAHAKAEGYSVGRDGDTVVCSYNPGTDQWFAWHVGYVTGDKDRKWRKAKYG